MMTSLRTFSFCFFLAFTVGCNTSSPSNGETKGGASSKTDAEKKTAKKTSKKSKKNKAKSKKVAKSAPKATPSPEPKTLPKPDKPGAAFQPPASKAVEGKWNIRVSDKYVPKGVDKIEDGLANLTRGTLKFSDGTAVMDIMGQAEARKYNVVREDGKVLELGLGNAKEAAITVTFLDHDNIFVVDKGRGELIGHRDTTKVEKSEK